MVQQSQETKTQQQEVSRRQERAHRILDAAAVLIQRWGYNKTTLDDISRQARVAKGTIYLHWKTREELFRALIKREKVEMAEDLKQRIKSDPEGSTPRGILKHSALAMLKRPLMKAILLRDMDMLGKLAHSEQNNAVHRERVMGFKIYLEMLREREVIRTDLSLRKQVFMYSAIFLGFFMVAPFMPEEFKLSDEEIADLMAEAIHRTLEHDRPVSSDTLQAISRNFIDYLERAMNQAQE